MIHLIAALLLAATPVQLDSQVVLERYARTLLHTVSPRALIFSYSVSQAGPTDIDQTHRIYRSGELVRDETLMVDGVKQKSIRIARYRDRYTLQNLAPRLTEYMFLFDGVTRSGSGFAYKYHAVPIGAVGAYVVDSMLVDGRSYLPTLLRFHSVSGGVTGKGAISFMRSGKYWVPQSVSVEATIHGKNAREHITFSGYSFPLSLPKSTFQAPRPLPLATPSVP